jgi:Tol biopolymer transport system component
MAVAPAAADAARRQASRGGSWIADTAAISFAGDREEILAANHPDRDRHAALIGLYGELITDSPGAGGPFDGSSNLVQVSFASEGACFDPEIDRTGRIMAFASTMHRATSDVYIKQVNGKTITQLTSDPADDVMPAFSPDGASIAFASNRAGNWDIFVLPTGGGKPTQITFDIEHELHPSYSPDGSTLAYCKFGAQSQRWEIWLVEVQNPSVRRFLEYGLFPQWRPESPDGRPMILFQRARQRGSRFHGIWTIDYIDGQAMHPTEIVSAANAAVINPAWSPDGSRVVFVTVVEPETEPGEHPALSDVWTVNVNGTDRTNLTNGQFANFQPAWGADGSVYFVSNRSGVDNIWAVAPTGGSGNPGTPLAGEEQPEEMATATDDAGAEE